MKIVPQYSLENAAFFVPNAIQMAESENVSVGRQVLSAPLVFRLPIPLTELAKTDLLLEENVIDSKWTIDPQNIRIETIAVKFPGLERCVNTNIGLNVPEALFGVGSANKPHLLTIVKKHLPVVIGLSEIATFSTYNERVASAPLLQFAAEWDLHLVFDLEVSGSVNLADGKVTLLQHQFKLASVLNCKGKKMDIDVDPELKKLAEYLESAEATGYYIDANWLQTNEAETYQYELGDPNPIGRGVALLVRGYLLSVPCVGYAAEVTEPSMDRLGVTKLYMQPDRTSKEEWYVTVEEGFDLPPGECNVVFHALAADWKDPKPGEVVGSWFELGRWESIAPGTYGQWVEAIAQFLLDGEEYYLTNTLPESIPNNSGHRAVDNG